MVNKLCLGKISHQKTVRIKFSINSGFSNMLYGKKMKTLKPCKSTETLLIQKNPVLMIYQYCKTAIRHSICYLSTILALITKKATFKLQW